MVTKADLVELAFRRAAMFGLVMQPEPEDIASGATELEVMVREWEPSLKIGYSLSPSPFNVDITTDSMIADTAISAVCYSLAERLLLHYGKDPSIRLTKLSTESKNQLYCVDIPVGDQNPLQPAGAGMSVGSYYMPEFEDCDCDDWPTPNC